MAKIKDTDYLSISARIRSMETRLLNRERMDRMLDARADDEAAKVLSECGYGELPALTNTALDAMLAAARSDLYRDLKNGVPDARLVDVFQMKYDYHNAKVLIKAQAMGIQSDRLLMDGGRWSAETVRDAFSRDNMKIFSDTFRRAILQARDVLGASSDPQLADFVLDRAWFEEMMASAQATGSEFLVGYVRLLIDAANLRSVVRAARMGKGSELLMQILIEGGNVNVRTLASGKDADLGNMFRGSPLASAAALGSACIAPESGGLTTFERACDNAVMHYLSQARRIPFGEQTVIGYLYAKESEFTAIRIILSGRMAGLSAETIRERLREAYV